MKAGGKVERKFDLMARGYVRKVLSGKIAAPEFARLACERHARDMKNKDYRWDKEAGERVCRFLEMLPHTKGSWAVRRELMILEPWQCFIVMSLFAWKWKSTGKRRYRSAYIAISRKNGKTMLAAGLGLYMLAADGEPGAEVYSAGKTRDQAREVFDAARDIMMKMGNRAKSLQVKTEQHKIKAEGGLSVFEPLASESGALDGKNIHMAIADELHAHKNSEAYRALETGMGSREQPLLLSITTAGANKAGICFQTEAHVKQVLRGEVEDETTFGIIYAATDEDDCSSPAVWKMANPNFGVSIPAAGFKADYDKAKSNPSALTAFKNKRLNIWTNASSPWLKPGAWEAAGDSKIKPQTFADDEEWDCLIGVDLSNRVDLTAVAILFYRGKSGIEFDYDDPEYKPTENEYALFVRTYIPQARAEEREEDGYGLWRREGSGADLVVIPGVEISQGIIERDVATLYKSLGAKVALFDEWQAKGIMERLTAAGMRVATVRQTVRNMSPAMLELQAALYAGRLVHNADPCLSWQMGCVQVKVDERGNIFPRKENRNDDRLRIDGPLAALNAMARVLAGGIEEEEETKAWPVAWLDGIND